LSRGKSSSTMVSYEACILWEGEFAVLDNF